MRNKGFTLIELLVSLTVMMLLLGGGIASYINFNEKQQLIGSAREVQSYLRTAQAKARAGDVPDGCVKLAGYTLRAVINSSSLELVANCGNGDGVVKEYQINPSIVFTQTFSITFLSLTGGVSGGQTVSLSSNNRTYEFKVTQGGEISQGDLVN